MPYAVALTGANQAIAVPGADGYFGFSIRETAGAAAIVRIYDNNSAAGTIIEDISLAALESAREFYGDAGIQTIVGGLFVQIVSGTVEGSIRVG